MSSEPPADLEPHPGVWKDSTATSQDSVRAKFKSAHLSEVNSLARGLLQYTCNLIRTSGTGSIRRDWVNIMRSSNGLASVTVGVDASLFAFFEVGASYINPGRNGNVETAVKTLAYVALFNSLSMLLSSRLLTVALEMSSCSPEEQIVNPTGEPTEDRPGCYRLRTWAKFVYFEWIFSSLAAVLCTLASTATYAFTQELPAAALVVVLIAAVLAALPLVRFFVYACRG